MKDSKLLIACALFIAILVVGEVYVYSFDRDATYGIDVESDSDGLTYKISSKISNCYDVLVFDEGIECSEAYIYYDESYGSCLEEVDQPTGSKKLDQKYYISQLKYQLDNRGMKTITVDADGLRDAIDSGKCKMLIVVSGALPDTVYDGTSGSKVIGWLENGGHLYWAGNVIGKYIGTHNGVVEAPSGHQTLFLGSECIVTESKKADRSYDDTTNALSLMNNDLRYSVKTDLLSSPYLSTGYTDGKSCSIAIVGKGNGSICILGGDYSNNQRADLAQIVASHITVGSDMVAHEKGSVTRSTSEGHIGISQSGLTVYVYLGGYYLEYGKCFSF